MNRESLQISMTEGRTCFCFHARVFPSALGEDPEAAVYALDVRGQDHALVAVAHELDKNGILVRK